MIGPTLQQIYATLVSAYDGLKLSSGAFVTVATNSNSTPSGGNYPYLAFSSGSFTMTPWKEFTEQLTWDIPATLTVQGPGEDGEITARAVVQDLLLRTKQIQGLPIDAAGNLVAFGPDTIRLFDNNELSFIADRGAPYLRSVNFQPVVDGLCRVSLIFRVEALMQLDTRVLSLMKVGVLGVSPQGLFQDSTSGEGRGVALVFPPTDRQGFGGYASTDPLTGPSSAEVITQVVATPYDVSVSSGSPTVQLAAIVTYQNWQTNYITVQGMWLSSSPSVATVSAAGLVTRVGAGSTNVTCTFGGVVSNAVAVTSS